MHGNALIPYSHNLTCGLDISCQSPYFFLAISPILCSLENELCINISLFKYRIHSPHNVHLCLRSKLKCIVQPDRRPNSPHSCFNHKHKLGAFQSHKAWNHKLCCSRTEIHPRSVTEAALDRSWGGTHRVDRVERGEHDRGTIRVWLDKGIC